MLLLRITGSKQRNDIVELTSKTWIYRFRLLTTPIQIKRNSNWIQFEKYLKKSNLCRIEFPFFKRTKDTLDSTIAQNLTAVLLGHHENILQSTTAIWK